MHRSLVVLLLLAACGRASTKPPPGPPPDELDYALWPGTRLLGDADMAALTSSAPDGTLTFTGAPPGLEGVDVGSVLLVGPTAQTPHGLLRIVLKVDRQDGNLVLITGSAPL